ncbi:MAG: hypothetical protein JNM70_11665 [Anaerolineae bacterium]|nr:hypothetical protein [Anaerolineae bacterium]
MMRRLLIWLVIVAAGIGCFLLNWTVSNTATFTLSAADLAEWASLHPEARVASPPLMASLLLRLPAALIICLVVMQLRRQRVRGAVLIGIGLIAAISLLPPWEFFTQYSNDPNYRQQAALAAFILLFCIAVSVLRQDTSVFLEIGLALAAGISAVVGLGISQGLIRTFGIETGYGLGGIVAIAACFLLGAMLLREQVQSANG